MKRHILLTGPPGIGKTTVVKKVCNLLNARNVSVKGFFTEEIRNSGKRIGFDIVTLDGQRGVLARLSQTESSRYRVGQYAVSVQSFETYALPVFLIQPNSGGILVLDEIGRMELLSEKFTQEVQKAFSNPVITILATIPIPKGRPIPLIDSLRKRPDTVLLELGNTLEKS
ncbi:cancer-related nucleoside-triphosphatase homolog isoform X2 [Periplaneta americana]|uniref:cancer-related nucleoside-triphosphatase homolog isoform X2 n=1 Tax=Periplaneta americana TaxID=6978 RepID=UPI0037E93162